ncbi:MAG: DNA-protecting protein DprA [Bacteroidetes bacterium]|nr:DNA-protecting protein DprA [Bacteroidota bacterium]
MDEERLALLALRFTPGIGDTLFKALIGKIGTAREVFGLPVGKLIKVQGVGEATARAIQSKSTFRDAEIEIRRAEQTDTSIIFYHDPNYPHRLNTTPDHPAAIYVQGSLRFGQDRMLAVVGTRKCTPYGKSALEKILLEIRPFNPVIVSGLAYGIDIHAHRMAMELGMRTIAILGSGLDHIYPTNHVELARRMSTTGALISEQRFSAKPEAHYFPARNRIIAGLSEGVLVAEASEKGGALITADLALSYDREVFAIPGNILAAGCAGCNNLIKDHKAQLVTTGEEIALALRWTSHNGPVKTDLKHVGTINRKPLSPEEEQLMKFMDLERVFSIDSLSELTQWSRGTLTTTLLDLELAGRITTLPGNRYRLRK